MNKPLRILHVIASIAAESGGPAAVCAGLAGALAERGHGVAIATIERPGETLVPVHEAVQLHRFAIDGSPRYARSSVLEQWLAENTPHFDMVHLHTVWQFPTFAAARACWKTSHPYVLAAHGMLDRYSVSQRSAWLKYAYWLFRERRVASRAAVLHCLNHAEVRRAMPWIRAMPKMIVPNGIDGARVAEIPSRGMFRAAHPELADKQLVLFLSRLHPKKGLDRMIPAWKTLAEKMPEAQLVIAGTGDEEYVESLRQLVAAHQLTEQVLFLGQVTGAAKWELLVDADVFVLPSYQEGFSMAIVEALAAGTPPVMMRECNFDEVMPAPPALPAGVIIERGDMTAFCAAVMDLLGEPDKRQRFAAAGRALIAEHYTWQRIAAELEDRYREILAGRRFPAEP